VASRRAKGVLSGWKRWKIASVEGSHRSDHGMGWILKRTMWSPTRKGRLVTALQPVGNILSRKNYFHQVKNGQTLTLTRRGVDEEKEHKRVRRKGYGKISESGTKPGSVKPPSSWGATLRKLEKREAFFETQQNRRSRGQKRLLFKSAGQRRKGLGLCKFAVWCKAQ